MSSMHTATHFTVWYNVWMATNLALDEGLLQEALEIGGHRTKRATVTEALQEYIRRRKQKDLVRLFGTIEYDPDFDYKKQRKRP